jgi:hypothetical protein
VSSTRYCSPHLPPPPPPYTHTHTHTYTPAPPSAPHPQPSLTRRYGRKGETCGTIGVLEVRPHETITIYDGQPICMMEFFRNAQTPAKPYGFSGNNYGGQQGPKLAKFFA